VTDLDRATLERVLPPTAGGPDWEDVLRRSDGGRGRRRAGLVALVVAALVVAGTASALGTVRGFFLGTGVDSKIAFMHNTRKNCCPHELWIMNADGSNPARVARDATGGVAWSPDERQIAYWQASQRGSRGNKIYVVRPDGSGRRLLTRSGLWPNWSPDGQRIVFTSWRDRNWEIYVMNAGGGKHRNLTRNAGPDSNPVWSPDGRRILFMSRRDGNSGIYVMNADGSDQRNVSGDSGYDGFPVWSPDGQRIAFMSRRDGNSEIYSVNADGSDRRNLTRHAAFDGSPAWSPDGQRIAFTSRRSGVAEIHVMNADGSDQRSLRVRAGRDTGLGWSPDGRKIAFTAESTEVYVVNADGSDRRRLTRSPWANHFAGWSPGPRKGA
jgi:Tol biopolymer transport system component